MGTVSWIYNYRSRIWEKVQDDDFINDAIKKEKILLLEKSWDLDKPGSFLVQMKPWVDRKKKRIVHSNGSDTLISEEGEVFRGIIFEDRGSGEHFRAGSVVRWSMLDKCPKGKMILEVTTVRKVSCGSWLSHNIELKSERYRIVINLATGKSFVYPMSYEAGKWLKDSKVREDYNGEEHIPKEIARVILDRLKEIYQEEYGVIPETEWDFPEDEMLWYFISRPFGYRCCRLKDFLGDAFYALCGRDNRNPYKSISDFLNIPVHIRKGLYQHYLEKPEDLIICWVLNETGIKDFAVIKSFFKLNSFAGIDISQISCHDTQLITELGRYYKQITSRYGEEVFVKILKSLNEQDSAYFYFDCISMFSDFESVMPDSVKDDYYNGQLSFSLQRKMAISIWRVVAESGLLSDENKRYIMNLTDRISIEISWQPEVPRKLSEKQEGLWKSYNAAYYKNRLTRQYFAPKKAKCGIMSQKGIDNLFNGLPAELRRRNLIWPDINP